MNVLISGASFAGLSTAHWLNKSGHQVTVVEVGSGLKMGGTPVDIKDQTVDIVKRMGLFEQIKANRLNLELTEFKNADDITVNSRTLERSDDEFEIERDTLLNLLFDTIKDDVEFLFSNTITALEETPDNISVTFKDGSHRTYDLVLGCDGIHSVVRRVWFGPESAYAHFLGLYFFITIVNKSLIRQNTLQMYGVPNKGVMLNAYNNKTDIALMFRPEAEIPYDYRDKEQHRKIVLDQFSGEGWRVPELLSEVRQASNLYFDKFCQIKMSSWSKGRVALVGDAGYCASPAAGMGGSLAIIGATALADAMEKHKDNYELAFAEYDRSLRPFIDEVQAAAVETLEYLLPRTEEELQRRNSEGFNL
jgi:2-polyprenyl-6-methoxyphenol hydroxylase-like FAD-dependent oxidoreductase